MDQSQKNVTYMELAESVVVTLPDGPVTITKEDDRYPTVMKMIAEGNLNENEMIAAIDPQALWVNTGLLMKDNRLYPEGAEMPLPLELSNRIIEYRKKNAPFDSLLRFWDNLQHNPSFNSRAMLFKFLEHNNHPFTDDGKFLAYRSVTEDFKDHHTKRFDNSVGAVCEVARMNVDDNPNNTCSYGLHVAAWQYAIGFGSADRRLVEVEVDPRDVVAVPTDYHGTKMRVCKFKVLKEVEGPNDQFIYGHENEEFDNEDEEDFEEEESWEDEDDSDEIEESRFSQAMLNEVRALADRFEPKYSSDLAARIAEECSYEVDDIQEILDNHR